MKKSKLPKIDSIGKLADFWDTHDLTDFEEELQEVKEPVFARAKRRGGRSAISVTLTDRESRAVQLMAQHNGVSAQELIRKWVRQRIASRRNGR